MQPITHEELADRFDHHQLETDAKIIRHMNVREACLLAAHRILEVTGRPSREQSLAFTKLEEAMFWANAAIARDERPVGEALFADETKSIKGT